ncbi:hypothetical protein [Geodermatophilus sp. URMC 62]|uniref:hypothetical protein n=1 Tax=Geodermatophilus sp. URMC 62 TaxID=3423414 RepID=UPI00406CF37B
MSAALEHAVDYARQHKEAWVQETHSAVRGATDMAPLIHGWRGGERVALLAPARVNRDDALHAARLAAVGFGCDIVSYTTESWQTSVECNPTTASPWGPGEMQHAVDEHNALEAGWITETLVTHVINRAGDVLGAFLPYRVTRRVSALGITSYALAWQEPASPSDGEWSGLVVDSLVGFMKEPTTAAVLARAGVMPSAQEFGLSDEEARAHMDCALVKTLHRSDYEGSLMLLADSAVRASVIEHSLGRRNTMRRPT